MVLFIIIFFAMVIIVGAASVIAFSFFLKRRAKRLQSQTPPAFAEPPKPYRSLFEPDEEEIQIIKREEKIAAEAKIQDAARQESEAKIFGVNNFENIWRNLPDVKNTAEFLRLAAESGSGRIFTETAGKIIRSRDDKKINLSARDLADLLDSHLRLLPQQESTSGDLFRLKEEIAELRRKSEAD